MNDSDTPTPSPGGTPPRPEEDFIPSDLSTLSFDEARNALPFFEENGKGGEDDLSGGPSAPRQKRPIPAGSSPLADIPAVKTSPPETFITTSTETPDDLPQIPQTVLTDDLPAVPDGLPAIPGEEMDDSFPPVPGKLPPAPEEESRDNDLPPVPDLPLPVVEELPAKDGEDSHWEDDVTTIPAVPGHPAKRTPPPADMDEEEEEEDYLPRKRSAKKPKQKLTAGGKIVLCLLALVIAGGGGYKVYQNRLQEEAEQCRKAEENMKNVLVLNGISLATLLELPLDQFPKDMAGTGKALRDAHQGYASAVAGGNGKIALESAGKISRDYQELVWNEGVTLAVGKWHADKKEWDKAEALLTPLKKKHDKAVSEILSKNPALAQKPKPQEKAKPQDVVSAQPDKDARNQTPPDKNPAAPQANGKLASNVAQVLPADENTTEQDIKQAVQYVEGKGAAQDSQKGIDLLDKHARKGNMQAALALASYYDSGKFLTRSKEKALEYYNLALLHGDVDCLKQAQTLRLEITDKTERTRPVPAYEVEGNFIAVESMDPYSKIPFLVCLGKDAVHLYDSFTGTKVTEVPLEKGMTGSVPRLELFEDVPFCAVINPQTGRLVIIDLDNASVCFQTTLDNSIPANRSNRKLFSGNKLIFWEGENLLCYQLTPRKKEIDLLWKLSKKDLVEDQPPSPAAESDGFLFQTFGDKSNDFQQNLAVWINGLMVQIEGDKSPSIRQTTAKNLGVSPDSKPHYNKNLNYIVQFRTPEGKAWLLNLYTQILLANDPISLPDGLTLSPPYKEYTFYSLAGHSSQAGRLDTPLPEVKNVPQAQFRNWTAGRTSDHTVFCLQYQENGQEKCTLIGSPTSEIKNLWREDIGSPQAGFVMKDWVFLPKDGQAELFFIKAGPKSKVTYPLSLPTGATITPGASNYAFLIAEQRNPAGEITKVCVYKNANDLTEFVEKNTPAQTKASSKKMPAQLEKDLKNVIRTYARARNAGTAANIAFFFGNSVNYMYRKGTSSREDIQQDIQEGLDRWVERSVQLEKMEYSMNDAGTELYAQVLLKFSYLDANGKKSSGKTRESWTLPLSGPDYGKITVWSEKVVK